MRSRNHHSLWLSIQLVLKDNTISQSNQMPNHSMPVLALPGACLETCSVQAAFQVELVAKFPSCGLQATRMNSYELIHVIIFSHFKVVLESLEYPPFSSQCLIKTSTEQLHTFK